VKIPISHLPDKDMQNAPKALARAAKRAKELARQTGTEFVVMRDGKLIREIPQPEVIKREDKENSQ
jgi:sensor histidine kinase regulating citrate/malate metabolism